MPLYEYRCDSCGEKEEKLEGFSAPTEHGCEHCGAEAGMKRQISLAAFNLAGGGWHSQGYSGPAPAKKEAATEAPPEAPAAPKSGCSGGCACHSPTKDN
jgi:putative FmdB family regulatory protein